MVVYGSSLCYKLLASHAFLQAGTLGAIKSHSFVLKNYLRILNKVTSVLNLPETSAYVAVCFNHASAPPWSDNTFHAWRGKGLISMALYIDGWFTSFSQLREKFVTYK